MKESVQGVPNKLCPVCVAASALIIFIFTNLDRPCFNKEFEIFLGHPDKWLLIYDKVKPGSHWVF